MTKKQPKKSDDSDDNFLDHDELEMVSSDRHAWTFDQVIMVAEDIPRDDRIMVTSTVPRYYHTVAIVRALASDYDVSMNLVFQAALEHGVAMFEHTYSDLLTLLENLERTAISNDTRDYFEHSVRVNFGRDDVGKYPVYCTPVTSAALTNMSGLLRSSKKDIAGAAILMSLLTDPNLDASSKTMLESKIRKIKLTLSLQKTVATNLI